MKWKQLMGQKVTWQDIWKWDPQNQTHPTSRGETPACTLRSSTGMLECILTSCSKALGEGCYCWRHEWVLKTTVEAIRKGIGDDMHSQVHRVCQRGRAAKENTKELLWWSAFHGTRLGRNVKTVSRDAKGTPRPIQDYTYFYWTHSRLFRLGLITTTNCWRCKSGEGH